MDAISEAAGDDEIRTSAHEVCSNEDILSKILAGLPLSSLRLYKSVCKQWFSLITDPFFNSLRNRSPNADHPIGLFFQLQQPSSVFAYLQLTTSSRSPNYPSIRTNFPFYPTNSPYIQLLQSCNGLLLFYGFPYKLYVCNPITNHCKLLPSPHYWKDDVFLTSPALAFDPALSPHYKLVYASPGKSDLEIYSSETGNWGYAQIWGKPDFMMFDWRVVYWRGAIHWRSRLCVYHLSLDDIHNPRFIQIENSKNNLCGVVFGHGDRLSVSPRDCLLLVKIIRPLLLMIVYELNDYSSGWSVKYRVNIERSAWHFSVSQIDVLSVVLGETEEDLFLVLEVTGIALIRYNIISKTFHELCDLTHMQLRTNYFHTRNYNVRYGLSFAFIKQFWMEEFNTVRTATESQKK